MGSAVMLAAWMYVSQATYSTDESAGAIESIEAVSLRRNRELGITGALIFAGGSITQYIEGADAAVQLLRETISIDPRHRDLWTICDTRLDTRRFDHWSVVYRGLASYVEREILSARREAAPSPALASAALMRLFDAFART